HGMVQRVEYRALNQSTPTTAVIAHCDTGKVYAIKFDKPEYVELKITTFQSQEQFEKRMAQELKEDHKHAHGDTVDTGETREFNGFTAKHLITTISGNGKTAAALRGMVDLTYKYTIDGWYLDIPQPGCAPGYLRQRRGHMEWYPSDDHPDSLRLPYQQPQV